MIELSTNEKGNLEIENKENKQKLEVNFEEIMKKLEDYLDFYYCGIFDPECKYVYQCLTAPRKQYDDYKMQELEDSGWKFLSSNRNDVQDVDIYCKLKSDLTEEEKKSFEDSGCQQFRNSFLDFYDIQEIKKKNETNKN